MTGASTVRILEAGRRFTPYEVAHPEWTQIMIFRCSRQNTRFKSCPNATSGDPKRAGFRKMG